jgi:hypothetical protein
MGLSQSLTNPDKKQALGQGHGRGGPRRRWCLLKKCGERFRPQRACQRYCSPGCGAAARKWSRWKAQEKYRATRAGQEKRNGQSRRYRERVRQRKQAEEAAGAEAARVIPQNLFWDGVRPAGVLRMFRAHAPQSRATVLFAGVSAGAGARLGAGAALAAGPGRGVESAWVARFGTGGQEHGRRQIILRY